MVSYLSKLIAASSRHQCRRIMAIHARNLLRLFQVTRDDDGSTEEPASEFPFGSALASNDSDRGKQNHNLSLTTKVLEPILIFLCFALFAGQFPPDVNESHYLTKAKHFWNPDWCSGDIFLSSSFAHWLFYATTGWLTKVMSLSATAWTGRIVTWALLAFAWRRLSWRLVPAGWMSVFSAIFFLLLNERFHMAGEWVVGGFEAKGIAYFFVLLALGSLVQRDWNRVWPLLGAAAAFHVLVGGWAFLATLFVLMVMANEQSARSNDGLYLRLKKHLTPFGAGIALALVGAIPPFLADQSAPAGVAVAARSIYVNHRIAHHLRFDEFPTLHIARFAIVVVFWYLLNRWMEKPLRSMHQRIKPIFLFALGSLLISFGGLLLSGAANQPDQLGVISEGLLRFYWFRIADFAIPAGTALTSCAIVCHWLVTDRRISTRASYSVFLVCILGAGSLIVMEKFQDPRPRADQRSLPNYPYDAKRTLDTYRNWRKVCQWISENTSHDATFITPHEQQTFKWYAQRAEVVCWKDVPQDSLGILDWNQRLAELYEPQRIYENGLMSYSDEQLRDFAKRYGASHLLVPQRHIDLTETPTTLRQVYPSDPAEKSTYVVFEF